MSINNLSFCGDITSKYDHDRFLCCLFTNGEAREALFSIFAFNYEIGKINNNISEALIGQIKLQWWRDEIDKAFNHLENSKPYNNRNKIMQSLFMAIKKYNLCCKDFHALIDARNDDFDTRNFNDINDIVNYSSNINTPLIYLSGQIFYKNNDAFKEIANNIGTAWGLIGLMRATPFLIEQRNHALPRQILKNNGHVGAVEKPSSAVNLSVKEICLHAIEILDDVKVTKDNFCPPLLLKIMAQEYLRRFKKTGYDPFNSYLTNMSPMIIPRLYFANFINRF